MLVERWVEGDRNARMKLDQQPLSFNKALRKTAKHVLWVVIAAATGGAWILYFQEAPPVTSEVVHGTAGGGTSFLFGLLHGTPYLLAAMARETVCTYIFRSAVRRWGAEGV